MYEMTLKHEARNKAAPASGIINSPPTEKLNQ